MVRAMRALIENCILNEVWMRWFLKIEEGVVESWRVDGEVVWKVVVEDCWSGLFGC
jgi:hypothetical protein